MMSRIRMLIMAMAMAIGKSTTSDSASGVMIVTSAANVQLDEQLVGIHLPTTSSSEKDTRSQLAKISICSSFLAAGVRASSTYPLATGVA